MDSDRPQEGNELTKIGNWAQLDTVYSSSAHKTAIVTIVDRKTRLLKAKLCRIAKQKRLVTLFIIF